MKKVIFLVDMNAFFISCEATRNKDLLENPAAVAGSPEKRTGIILASNYKARKFGVRTAMTVHQALRLCPHLLLVPPNHSFYEYKSREVMNLLSNYTPLIQKNSIDEAWLDMTGTEGLFGSPLNTAKKVMEDIKENLGLWSSIGISENKFLSKMASNMKKPLGITELWVKDIKKKLWPLPVGAMHGVGKKTNEKLNNIGVKTIRDLALLDGKILYKCLGNSGLDMQKYAQGIDPSPVEASKPGDMKSIGKSTTLSEDTKDIEKLKLILMELSEEVGIRARKYNKKGDTIQITLKYPDFKVINRQITILPTFYTKDIYQTGCQLLYENFSPRKPIRLIGITLKGFEEENQFKQISLFANQEDNSKDKKIDMVMDEIRSKYGKDKITRALLIKNKRD